jgi:uncharacterized protein
MKRSHVLELVKSHQTQLKEMGVISLDLFGSVARDQAHAESDVDFLVELEGSIGFFGFFRIKHYLEDLLECPIDLGTADALKEHLREPVLEEAIRVF